MKSNNNIEFNAACDLIYENSITRPKKLAFIDDDNEISYLELSKKVKSFAYKLCQNGLKKNDKVIICMHDCINFPIVFLGSIWAGIVPICINTMLQKNDLEYMLEDSEAKAIICSENLFNTFQEIIDSTKKEILIFSDNTLSSAQNKFNINLSSMMNSKVVKNLPEKTFENSECFWLYSSGSTGKPKGTIHLHKS